MPETFVPPVSPARGATIAVAPNVYRAEFGGNLVTRWAAGINTQKRQAQLKFGPITVAQADTIEAFLRARGGTAPFWYRLPDMSVSILWTCVSWSRNVTDGDIAEVSLVLAEEFDMSGTFYTGAGFLWARSTLTCAATVVPP